MFIIKRLASDSSSDLRQYQLKLLLIDVAFILIVFLGCVSGDDEECAIHTACTALRDCPLIRDNFHLYPAKPYCNLDIAGTYVCCPKLQSPYNTQKDKELRGVQVCRAYSDLNLTCSVPLIVNGVKAQPKELPFMALLYYRDASRTAWLCGGTLISRKYILTASHCFFETLIPNWVRLGELDYDTNRDDALPQDIQIAKTIIHNKYYSETVQSKYNDIALVEMKTNAIFNEYVRPACLPLSDGRDFNQYLAAGWGKTRDTGYFSSHLLKVKLDAFEDEQCSQLISRNEELQHGINHSSQMCAGSFSDSRDTCSGDSGGPLFVYHPDFKCQYIVLGITSFGEGGCGNKGFPAVYTRVQFYLDWIEQRIWK